MPDGRGSLFDVLDRAARRGLDVRVIFWRHTDETAHFVNDMFAGSADQREMLGLRDAQFSIRWDRAASHHCHHQKSWIVDAGRNGEIAFVGGINLNRHSVVAPGHAHGPDTPRHNHDLYLELAGPSASDVHHNFVQRWRGASDRHAEDGAFGPAAVHDPAFPLVASPPRGQSFVQVQRTIHPALYAECHCAPDAADFDIHSGEQSVFDQYCVAITAAKQSVYIENQSLLSRKVLACLEAALERGVIVVALLPAEAEGNIRRARQEAEWDDYFRQFEALSRFPHFALIGIAGPDEAGARHPVYVHDKAMLLDDHWSTIGSCNLRDISFTGHTEMNASIWDAAFTRDLRVALLAEHLEQDTSALDDRSALALCISQARANAGRPHQAWEGHVFALDPATYGF